VTEEYEVYVRSTCLPEYNDLALYFHAGYYSKWFVKMPITGRWKLVFDHKDNCDLYIEVEVKPKQIKSETVSIRWLAKAYLLTIESEKQWIHEDNIEIRKKPKPEFIGNCNE
jgi:hypothetical protein